MERVDLVAHSMGGLVVRDVLTRSAFYAGRAASASPATGLMSQHKAQQEALVNEALTMEGN